MSFENRNLLIRAIELARYSGVPMLFFSNPGFGKTTVVELWARHNGYHVETVIGSAWDRSEIGGFMVKSDKDYLDLAKPYWFHNIEEKEKNGIPSVLFIDEISTAPADVQGSIFRLIFSRCLQDGTKLPESTLILSAANYKDNLPSYFDIATPTLNRFCLINIGFKGLDTIANEFLADTEDDDISVNWPIIKFKEIGEEKRKELKSELRNFFSNMIDNYSENASDFSKGFIDINNKNISDIYSSDLSKTGEVFNFISGRTISYLYRICATFIGLGFKTKDPLFGKILDGLIGIGTNSFKKDSELKTYRNYIRRDISKIVSMISGTQQIITKDSIFDNCQSVADMITKLSENLETFTNATDLSTSFMVLYKRINSEYPIDSANYYKKIKAITTTDQSGDAKIKIAQFKTDMDQILFLKDYLFEGTNFEKIVSPFKLILTKTLKFYEFYKVYSV